MTTAMGRVRLPASAVTSLLLHAAFFAAFLRVAQPEKRQAMTVISNVGLMIERRTAAALPVAGPKSPAPPSMMNFLKMALPLRPRAAALQDVAVKRPEAPKAMAPEIPGLEERRRAKTLPQIEALDLSQRRANTINIEDKLVAPKRAAALAALEPLQEVGARRVRDLPQAIALEERRREAASAIQQAGVPLPTSRVSRAQAVAILAEATPQQRARLGDKMPEIVGVSERIELKPQEARPQPREELKAASVAAPKRQAGLELDSAKKGVELQGPLADRSLVSYEIPEFPAWARAQGIGEASVAIRFTVTREGLVQEAMRVEMTSGYGRLDRLAMKSLKRWRFVPIALDEIQWGIVTFRFLLE